MVVRSEWAYLNNDEVVVETEVICTETVGIEKLVFNIIDGMLH